MTTIKVGTRGSALARIQTAGIVERLRRGGLEVEQVVLETRGDRDQEAAFAEFGGPGVFVREIEEALLDGRIDVAVHSYKDLPSEGPEGLTVAAVPERLDPADHLLVRDASLASSTGRLPLAEGARVGTSSARRQALLRHQRADLEVAPLRGNVDTRVRLLVEGRYDAIVLAGAGLQRLRQGGALELSGKGIHDRRLDPEWFVPAPAQGALAVQVRRADPDLLDRVRALDDAVAARALDGERRLLARVEGNCDLPFGAWCRRQPGGEFVLGFAMGDGEHLVVEALEGDEPLLLADRAWDHLAATGMAVR